MLWKMFITYMFLGVKQVCNLILVVGAVFGIGTIVMTRVHNLCVRNTTCYLDLKG